jgi:hypothetical protein
MAGTVGKAVASLRSNQMRNFFLSIATILWFAHNGYCDAIYWTDAGTGKVQSANLDGSGVRDVVTGRNSPDLIAFDPVAETVFWTEHPLVYAPQLWRSDSNGSDQRPLSYAPILSLQVDAANRTLYGSEFIQEQYFRSGLDGSAFDPYPIAFSRPLGLAIDSSNGGIYIGGDEGRCICRIPLDFSDQDQVAVIRNLEYHQRMTSLALDPVEGKLYWTIPQGDERILRANVDGTELEVVLDHYGGYSASGIALDIAGRKIYWADPEGQAIRRANLDGSDVETLVTGLSQPAGIALDLTPVPEPSAVTLAGIAIGLVLLRRSFR